MQNEPLCGYARRLDFLSYVFRHGGYIVHNLHRFFENVRIHALKAIILDFSVTEKIHLKRRVYMPVYKRFEIFIFPLHAEFATYRLYKIVVKFFLFHFILTPFTVRKIIQPPTLRRVFRPPLCRPTDTPCEKISAYRRNLHYFSYRHTSPA